MQLWRTLRLLAKQRVLLNLHAEPLNLVHPEAAAKLDMEPLGTQTGDPYWTPGQW